MILTDREIRTAIKKRAIIIVPEPPESAYSSISVDLTLDEELTIFKQPNSGNGIDTILDPAKRTVGTEDALKALTNKINIPSEGYVLNSRELILGYTKEYVDLRVETK